MRRNKLVTTIILSATLTLTACTTGNNVNLGKDQFTPQANIDEIKVTNPDENDVTDINTEKDTTEAGTQVIESLSHVPYSTVEYDYCQYCTNIDGYSEMWMDAHLTTIEIDETEYTYSALREKVAGLNSAFEYYATNEETKEMWDEQYGETLQNGGTTYPYSKNQEMYVTRADETIFSISVIDESYLGGAHPATFYGGINLDPLTGEDLTSKDLLNQDEDVAEYITNYLIDAYGIDWFFAETKEELKQTIEDIAELPIYVTYEGVVIPISQYTLAPYAAGMQYVPISAKDNPELLNMKYFQNLDEDYIVRIGDSEIYFTYMDGEINPIVVYGYCDNAWEEYEKLSVFSDEEIIGEFEIFSCGSPTYYLARIEGQYYLFAEFVMMDPGQWAKIYSITKNSCVEINDISYNISRIEGPDFLTLRAIYYYGMYPFAVYAFGSLEANGEVVTEPVFISSDDGYLPEYKTLMEIDAQKVDAAGVPMEELITVESGATLTAYGVYVSEDGVYFLFRNDDDCVALKREYDENYCPTYGGVQEDVLFDLEWY